ncbi:MAG: leucyl aminopeptidase [Candidatus Nanoarchaeia archaeon]
MELALFSKDIEKLETECLILGYFEDEKLEVTDALANVINSLSKRIKGEYGKIAASVGNEEIEHIVLVGLGKKEELTPKKAKEVIAKAANYARDHGMKEISFLVWKNQDQSEWAYHVVEAVRLSQYHFHEFKSEKKKEKIERCLLIIPAKEIKSIDKKIREALIVTDAVLFVRDLQNKPSNIVTPAYLAEEAKKLAKRLKLKCSILEKEDMIRLNMGGILAVNQGSSKPPKLIVLEYDGGKETICFVGKGITFDAGGISLKPAEDMDEMKFDMSGGAAVLGIIWAASELKLPYRIVGLVPATENLPGGNAYKPGDIIRFHNGKTAEIINTDAEGRVVLADALAFSKKFNPSIVIDFATLTGACVVALGNVKSGLFSDDEVLVEKLKQAGKISGEEVWQLPMDDEYKEYVKSDVADIKNCGPKWAGATTAALFLKEFIPNNVKWAHLDIAGTAWDKKGTVLNPAGGTGVGVRLGIGFLKKWK